MQFRRGETYWSAWFDDETGRVYVDEYVARTVNKNGAYLTIKIDGLTWVKRSKRKGDYGFAPVIPRYAVTHVRPGSAHTFRLTKPAAVRARIAWIRRTIGHVDEDDRREIEALKRWLKRNAK